MFWHKEPPARRFSQRPGVPDRLTPDTITQLSSYIADLHAAKPNNWVTTAALMLAAELLDHLRLAEGEREMPFPQVPAGALMVDPLSGLPGGGWNYTHIGALTAGTTIKVGGGVLHAIIVNTKGASSNLLTLYDQTTAAAPIMAVIDTTSTVGAWAYDLTFTTGLTVALAAGTASDLTIVWR